MKIEVRKQGRFYTLNGEIVRPDRFIGIDGFKFVNHIWAWVMGGALGEEGGIHLDRARRYLEHEVLGLGCRRMRAPVELWFWDEPYFDLPARPNVANTNDLVNLHVGKGSSFRMTDGLRKVIRMYVVLAREFDIVIEVPWLWTIKGHGEPAQDPRFSDEDLEIAEDEDLTPSERAAARERIRHDVSTWNEHYLGNEDQGIGRYLFKLRTEGDGEGEHRVDPGGLNLLADAVNEYTAHAEIFTQSQLQNVARRWHDRDAKGELLLISQSGPATRYDPPLASLQGSSGFDGVCIHPPRSGAWEATGTEARNKWPQELIDFNEAQMGWTEEQREFWVPQIPKWAGLGSTDMERWEAMHRNFLEEEIYTTFHTFRGMDASWPESPQTIVEETIRAITGASPGPGPGPGPDPEPPPVTGLQIRRNDGAELVVERDPEMLKGGDEAFVLRDRLELQLPAGRRLERLLVFHGLDRGDVVEMDTEIHANGKTIYARSEHKETTAPFNAWDTWDPVDADFSEELRSIEISVLCRVNGENPFRGGGEKLQARPHWGIRFVWN